MMFGKRPNKRERERRVQRIKNSLRVTSLDRIANLPVSLLSAGMIVLALALPYMIRVINQIP